MTEWIKVSDRLPELEELMNEKLILYSKFCSSCSGWSEYKIALGRCTMELSGYRYWVLSNEKDDTLDGSIRVSYWAELPDMPVSE